MFHLLNKSALIPILSDWLKISSVGIFDSACCNKSDRVHLLDILSSDSFKQSTEVKEKDCFEWILLRKIKLKNVDLSIYKESNNKKDFSFVSRIIKSCKPSHVKVHYHEGLEDVFVEVFLDSLILVESHSCLSDEVLESILKTQPELLTLNVYDCSELTEVACAYYNCACVLM